MTTIRPAHPFRSSRPALDYALTLDDDRRADRRSLFAALSLATAAHLALLVTRLPLAPPLPPPPAPPDVYQLNELPLAPPKPPEPTPTRPPESPESALRVPVPAPLAPPIEPLPAVILAPVEPLLPTLAPPTELTLPEPPAVAEPLRVGGDVQPPVRLSGERPVYTEAARKAHRQGVVIVDAVIGVDGAVEEIEVIKGLGFGLDREVVRALSKWRFRPGTLHGEPVAVRYNLTVRFETR